MAQSNALLSDRAQRFPLTAPLHFRTSGMSQWLDGQTVNMSRTGILFQANEEIPVNSVLDMQVDLSDTLMLECQCSVVRTEKSLVAVNIHRHSLTPRP